MLKPSFVKKIVTAQQKIEGVIHVAVFYIGNLSDSHQN